MPNLSLLDFPFPGFGQADWSIAPQVHLRLNYFGEFGDDTPPVVALISPAAGSTIARATPVVVQVTDETTLRRVMLVVRFPALGIAELAFNGTSFEQLYAAGSSRNTVGGGFQYSLLRGGGWPVGAALEVATYAIDIDGNEA